MEITISEGETKFRELNALQSGEQDNLHPRRLKELALENARQVGRILNKPIKLAGVG